MTWLFINAMDVWFFRDGRPFTAGEGHTAGGMFPPAPHTVQGALRGLILGQYDVEWQTYLRGNAPAEINNLIGNPQATGLPGIGKFAMRGPFLARRDGGGVVERMTILPNDVIVAQDQFDRYSTLSPSRADAFMADEKWSTTHLQPLWHTEFQKYKEVEDEGWLPEDSLNDYLNATAAFMPLDHSAIYDEEPRLGIGINYAHRRPAERMLYQARFVRPKAEFGLLVDVAQDIAAVLPEAGLLALGGERRAARWEKLRDDQVNAKAGLQSASKLIKVVLLTPAYFSNGWQPKGGVWKIFFGGNQADLKAIALKRPLSLGGWDLRGRHKPMRALVPAGSVYFFETDGLPQGSFTETPANELPFDRLGFGQFVVGKWQWLN